MIQLGLTGGIASGKSAVAERLASRGAVIIDSDLLAREAVAAGSSGLAALVSRFGESILAADGTLDRAVLARVIFSDPQARAEVEAIIHPRVRARAAELAAAAPADAVVVQVVPLLVEVGLADAFDAVIVVDVDPAVQVQRLQQRNGFSIEEAHQRIAAQASREERLACADAVIDNNAGLGELDQAVDSFWNEVLPSLVNG